MGPLVTSSDRRLPDPGFWSGRSVLVTGHTGFKGSWLVRWLTSLGAEVHGLSLDPPTHPSLFESAALSPTLASDVRGDVRDQNAVHAAVKSANPSTVLHLAAQPLVRDGYRDPAATLATNVIGTANVLASIRRSETVESVVIVTTDKVYRPRELTSPDRDRRHAESDPLGAEDPYGWSKVMAEQAVAAFWRLPTIDGIQAWGVPIATARAGNVVGGGDWSSERLVPDCIRAFLDGRTVMLRYPSAVRPWQHVLEPISGYLLLAETLATGALSSVEGSAPAYNFGPDATGERTVEEVASAIAERWGGGAAVAINQDSEEPPENPVLRLDSSLAQEHLGWKPRWGHGTMIAKTTDWYRSAAEGEDPAQLMDEQIAEFTR